MGEIPNWMAFLWGVAVLGLLLEISRRTAALTKVMRECQRPVRPDGSDIVIEALGRIESSLDELRDQLDDSPSPARMDLVATLRAAGLRDKSSP